MAHFIKDNTALFDVKVNHVVRADIPANKKQTATDWNQLRQALLDVQGFLRGAPWVGVEEQGADPAPSGLTKYLWVDTSGEVQLHRDGANRVLGPYVSAKSYGVVGDGVTDDRAALIAAINGAAALGAALRIPTGRYRVSKYIEILNKRGLRIFGDPGAIIEWPSDDTTIPTDTVATSDEMARSCFLLKNCTSVVIERIKAVGRDNPNLLENQGSFAYATRSVGVQLDKVVVSGGYSLFAQDDQDGTSGTGDSIAVVGSTVTITDAAGLFVEGHVDRYITLAGCTNRENDRMLRIASFISANQVTAVASDMVAETSSFRWQIDDNDRGTVLSNFHSINQRGFIRTASHSLITDFVIERPTHTLDTCGRAHAFSITGTTVTLTSPVERFIPAHVGKIVAPAGSTSAGNNGFFRITSVAVDGKSLTYENAAGVTELAPSGGTWWIANGEKAGLGNGAGALAKAGSTMTLTVSEDAFTASDIGKAIRVAKATTSGNNGSHVITGVPAANQVTYENSGGTAEAFSGVWSVDSFDASATASNTHGSTHTGYVYADRENIKWAHGIIRGGRKAGLKFSGSAAPIHNITVDDVTFEEVGEPIIFGADDSQEHTGITISNIVLKDCGNNRAGASESHCISVLGSRGATIRGVTAVFTRNSIASVDGRGVGGLTFLQASRSVAGVSQPVEDLEIDDVRVVVDPQQCTDGSLFSVGINLNDIGQRAYYRTGGTLTKVGNVMTLTDPSAKFSPQLIGRNITLVNSTGGNDGTFPIETASGTTLTFTNAAGVGGGNSAGTYRIPERSGMNVSQCRISRCYLNTIAPIVLQSTNCVRPTIEGLTWANGTITFSGDREPILRNLNQIAANTQTAHLRFASGTSWPIVFPNNVPAMQSVGINSPHGLQIGVTSTPVDYPLLGVRGRAKVTNGFPQVVVPYGSRHVDGDTITVNGTVYTYKASAPAGNQFNSMAGLIALIAAQANFDCVEYGTHLTPSVATGHLLITWTAQSTVAGLFVIQASTLNPTAFPLLRNNPGANDRCNSRGEATAGPTPDKTVVWSPLCSFEGGATLRPDNAAAMTLLAGSYRALKNSDDAGACEVLTHGTDVGTEEFRWAL